MKHLPPSSQEVGRAINASSHLINDNIELLVHQAELANPIIHEKQFSLGVNRPGSDTKLLIDLLFSNPIVLMSFAESCSLSHTELC